MQNANGAIALQLGGATLSVPVEVIAKALLERVMSEPEPQPAGAAPKIGEAWHGGIYAGVTVHDDTPMHLVLLPGDEELNWNAAREWAAKQGGELPSRIDQLVLFKNLKSEFQPRWYWSGEQYAGLEGYAWFQYFVSGSQGDGRKDDDCRARAVRRLVIQ